MLESGHSLSGIVPTNFHPVAYESVYVTIEHDGEKYQQKRLSTKHRLVVMLLCFGLFICCSLWVDMTRRNSDWMQRIFTTIFALFICCTMPVLMVASDLNAYLRGGMFTTIFTTNNLAMLVVNQRTIFPNYVFSFVWTLCFLIYLIAVWDVSKHYFQIYENNK